MIVEPLAAQLFDTLLAQGAAVESGVGINDPLNCDARHWTVLHCQGDRDRVSTVELAMLATNETIEAPELTCQRVLPPLLHITGERTASSGGEDGFDASARPRLNGNYSLLVRELLKRQNHDGGWSLGSNRRDSAADVTGFVLEALSQSSGAAVDTARQRAIHFLRRAQRPNGSWDAAVGVRFTFGTAAAIRGLIAAGLPGTDANVAAGVNWLLVQQHVSGGWGENPLSNERVASQPATASQTAWSLSALLAAGETAHSAVARAVQFLIESQEETGAWNEPLFTLAGSELGLWHGSHLAPTCYALVALSRAAVAISDLLDEPRFVALQLVGSI
jgi:hypothetical protein